MVARRFEVHLVNLDPTVGSEIMKTLALPEGLGRFTLTRYEPNGVFGGQDIGEVLVGRFEVDGKEPQGQVYRTDDTEHPGVSAFNSQGRYAVSGPILTLIHLRRRRAERRRSGISGPSS